jgi:hypothetical protein
MTGGLHRDPVVDGYGDVTPEDLAASTGSGAPFEKLSDQK